jgi:hypothetical protein
MTRSNHKADSLLEVVKKENEMLRAKIHEFSAKEKD